MNTLIIYDSVYGNTEKIARSIGGGIPGDVKIVKTSEVDVSNMGKPDLLIIGAPTYGGKPSPQMLEFFNKLSATAVKGINVAVFDTRLKSRIVGIFGFAAPKIADTLKSRRAVLILPPEGFFVKGSKGPLIDGESERAAEWTKSILEAQKTHTSA